MVKQNETKAHTEFKYSKDSPVSVNFRCLNLVTQRRSYQPWEVQHLQTILYLGKKSAKTSGTETNKSAV